MTNDNLFEDVQPGQTVDPEKDYFAELVGEDKRFKSPQDIARSKIEGDLHIARLEKELEGVREELSSRASMEQLVTELKKAPTPEGTPSEGSNSGHQTGGENSQQAITEEQIEQLINSRLQKSKQADQREQNFNLVKSELQKAGVSAEALAKATTELGLSQEQSNELASTNPKAFLRMVGVGAPAKSGSNNLFTQGNVDPQKIAPGSGAPAVRNNAYYEKLRTSDDPATRENYWSRETQMQLHQDAISQGESFFTT
jgi:hypothetical protein